MCEKVTNGLHHRCFLISLSGSPALTLGSSFGPLERNTFQDVDTTSRASGFTSIHSSGCKSPRPQIWISPLPPFLFSFYHRLHLQLRHRKNSPNRIPRLPSSELLEYRSSILRARRTRIAGFAGLVRAKRYDRFCGFMPPPFAQRYLVSLVSSTRYPPAVSAAEAGW